VLRNHGTHIFWIRRGTAYRVIAITLVALFLAGSARQIIPGMCATQRWVKECAMPTASGPVFGTCCIAPDHRGTDNNGGIHTLRDRPPFTPCAFCSLVATHTVVATRASAAIPNAPVSSIVLPHGSVSLAPTFWMQAARRGPPAVVCASRV